MAQKITLVIAAGLLLVTVCGCLESSRKESAQMRWQRTMDQARLAAAQQSIEDGRLAYAERILSECGQNSDPASDVARQVEQLRSRIQTQRQQYAKADDETVNHDQMTY